MKEEKEKRRKQNGFESRRISASSRDSVQFRGNKTRDFGEAEKV
jgi:hypothetical protein